MDVTREWIELYQQHRVVQRASLSLTRAQGGDAALPRSNHHFHHRHQVYHKDEYSGSQELLPQQQQEQQQQRQQEQQQQQQRKQPQQRRHPASSSLDVAQPQVQEVSSHHRKARGDVRGYDAGEDTAEEAGDRESEEREDAEETEREEDESEAQNRVWSRRNEVVPADDRWRFEYEENFEEVGGVEEASWSEEASEEGENAGAAARQPSEEPPHWRINVSQLVLQQEGDGVREIRLQRGERGGGVESKEAVTTRTYVYESVCFEKERGAITVVCLHACTSEGG